MTQLTHSHELAQITDRLETVGQRYRLQQTFRGLCLFVVIACALSLVAGVLAHLVGAGRTASVIFYAWIALVLAGFVGLVLLPFFRTPPLHRVARLIESRIDGLHNGLTNSLLLAGRGDLSTNPWTPLILSEIQSQTGEQPLEQAVNFGQLKRFLMRSGIALFIIAALTLILWPKVTHGLRQMFSPGAFVPQSAGVTIVSIRPGDTTLLRGQSLEVIVETSAVDRADLHGQLVVDPPQANQSTFEMPQVAPNRFAYRLEHIDADLRYRVDIAGTQSDFFSVHAIQEVKLSALSILITPPSYTRLPQKKIDWKVDDASRTPVPVPQGSTISASVGVDTPVNSALMQLGAAAPLNTQKLGTTGREFVGQSPVDSDTVLSFLLTDGSGQILTKVPDPALPIQCVLDTAPKIDMRWPVQDCAIAPDAPIAVKALVHDDYGLVNATLYTSSSPDQPLTQLATQSLVGSADREITFPIELPANQRQHGSLLRVQLEVTDNRLLKSASGQDLQAQSTRSPVYEIRFRDPQEIAKQEKEHADKLRELLRALLTKQRDVQTKTVAAKLDDKSAFANITLGQTQLREQMSQVASTFPFEESDRLVQKTLQMLIVNHAAEAIDFAKSIPIEPDTKQRQKLSEELATRQRRIIATLESLLAMLNTSPDLANVLEKKGGDLPTRQEIADNLKAALDQFMKEQRKILDQTAPLAKKPVDDFSDKDKKDLAELAMAQEKLDRFMQEKLADFSKLAEQDMSNASLLKELMEIYSEVTMAKDALKAKQAEIAVSNEEAGLELAQALTANLEKWLMDKPDRQQWNMEDPQTKTDTPMAELPKELQDMVGELMEQEEDLFEEMEDTNANFADSLNKGAGWDAADGPIANMSAQGVTGNALPNNNEMGGRAGEGRSGKSQGEMVEETATGKGGRMTPTRLDPTPFQQGQINDTSKDPVGGATGGGKLSGQGGAGLEGPVPKALDKEMQRLAQKQAEIRNTAERLNLQYQLGRYDNFQLLDSIAMMRRVESDIKSNRYQNALRKRDILLDAMDTSRLLTGSEIHVQRDSSPTVSHKLNDAIKDATKGDLPPAWSDALKAYYEKLGSK